MHNMLTRSIAALALMAVISGAPLMAQQPPQQQPGQAEKAKDPSPATGELIALDDQARTFAIRTEADMEMKFSYTEQTEIVGADKGVAGLSPKTAPRLVVHYGVHGTANTATKIEVVAKQ
jgi:hypothetical protein